MSQKRILIIDDDPSFLEICSAILIQFGYEVDTATNTGSGLEKLVSRRPDLLILDVMMAAMDEGISFANSLKKREDVGRIPIMIVSAKPDTEKGYTRTIDQDMDGLLPTSLWKSRSCLKTSFTTSDRFSGDGLT